MLSATLLTLGLMSALEARSLGAEYTRLLRPFSTCSSIDPFETMSSPDGMECTPREGWNRAAVASNESDQVFSALPQQILVPFYCPGPELTDSIPNLDPHFLPFMRFNDRSLFIAPQRFVRFEYYDFHSSAEAPVVEYSEDSVAMSSPPGWTLCLAQIDLGGFWPEDASISKAQVSFRAHSTMSFDLHQGASIELESFENAFQPGTQVGTGVHIPIDVLFNIDVIVDGHAQSFEGSASLHSDLEGQAQRDSALGCQMRSPKTGKESRWVLMVLLVGLSLLILRRRGRDQRKELEI